MVDDLELRWELLEHAFHDGLITWEELDRQVFRLLTERPTMQIVSTDYVPFEEGSNMPFGRNVIQRRIRNRMSQGRLSELTGIPAIEISRIEVEDKQLSEDEAEAIARALDTTVEELRRVDGGEERG